MCQSVFHNTYISTSMHMRIIHTLLIIWLTLIMVLCYKKCLLDDVYVCLLFKAKKVYKLSSLRTIQARSYVQEILDYRKNLQHYFVIIEFNSLIQKVRIQTSLLGELLSFCFIFRIVATLTHFVYLGYFLTVNR